MLFPTLYTSYPWLIYLFFSWKSVPPNLLPAGSHRSVSHGRESFLSHRQAFLCCTSDSTNKWYRVVFVFSFGCISPRMIVSGCVHGAASVTLFSFYAWEGLSRYKHHIFFAPCSAHGHVGCFCVLPVVNSAEWNTGVRVSFQSLVFSGYGVLVLPASVWRTWQACLHFDSVWQPPREISGRLVNLWTCK